MNSTAVGFFTAILIMAGHCSIAQGSLGFSINYGDRIVLTPDYPDFLNNSKYLTPTLVYAYQLKFASGFSTVFEAQAGATAYQIMPIPHDTISANNPLGPFILFRETLFVSRVGITPGKTFRLGKNELFIGMGGGVSYYLGTSSNSVSIFKFDQGIKYKIFSAVSHAPEHGTFAGFAEAQVRLTFTNRITMSFQYLRHFRSIMEGEFAFYNTQVPASGTFKFVPQGVSFQMLYQLRQSPTSGKITFD